MTPDEVAAREEIRRTLAAYHQAGDRGRMDDLVATFTEDGVLELSTGSHEGRAAIRAAFSGIGGQGSPRPAFVQHHLTTSSIEVEGPSRASGVNYFLVMSPIGVDHCGRYADRYRAAGERWLIAHRRVTVSWASPDSVLGAQVAPR